MRGLAILLPSVLTIWILLAAYQFVQSRIADPINTGVRTLIIDTTGWPSVTKQDIAAHLQEVLSDPDQRAAYRAANESPQWLRTDTRRAVLAQWWGRYHYALDLIGLILAIALIYAVGLVLGSFIGRRLYLRGEELFNRLPLVRRVYPSVKQVTDFFVGDKDQSFQFNHVVAVQYPSKGIWSVGLVTGETMRDVEGQVGRECLTIFVPSSPTPFTGYVVIVPRDETLDLPISIESAMKFIISGGVLMPPDQKIAAATETAPA